MEFINEAILHAAGQWWIYPILTIFCFIDGFVPILPSETLIVALGALSVTSGQPNMWWVMAAAALGAIAGDNMAYLLGRHVGVERFRWMRKPKVHRALNWARYELDKRGAMLIFTARYIPVGRVAVNWIAGTTAYPRRRFVILDIFASVTWVAYSAGVGIIAGNWVHEHPLLGVGHRHRLRHRARHRDRPPADLAAPLARHPRRCRGRQPGRHARCRSQSGARPSPAQAQTPHASPQARGRRAETAAHRHRHGRPPRCPRRWRHRPTSRPDPARPAASAG